MIDIATEKLLTLEQAADKLLVTKQVVIKWIRYGSKGIRLEAIKFGTHWRTSEDALQRFGNRLTPDYEPVQVIHTITSTQRQQQNEAVKAQLDVLLNIRRCESCKTELNTHKKTISKNEKLWCPQCLVKLPSATLAQRIRTFRWEAQISLDELVENSGLRLQLIRDFESGRKIPTPDQLENLVKVLGPHMISGL